MRRSTFPSVLVASLGVSVALSSGCVRRTLSITTDPPGALVILNDREVGRTPVEIDFTFYGTYDLRLLLEGYEPFVGSAKANAPIWDTMPMDFVSEILPVPLDSNVKWHFTLEPAKSEGVLERAEELRNAL